MNIDKIIKRYKFKLKFRDWQMLNDKKLIGKSYDYVFELFMYDQIEVLVKSIIDDHLDENQEIRDLKNRNIELNNQVNGYYETIIDLKDKIRKLNYKIGSLKIACKNIIEDL